MEHSTSGRKCPVIRPATEADIRLFYGRAEWSFRALAAELDGEVLAVGGIYYDGPNIVAFSSVKPGANLEYPFTAARMTRKIMEIVDGRACFAIASQKFDTAPALLERLGFERIEDRVYRWAKKSPAHSAPPARS